MSALRLTVGHRLICRLLSCHCNFSNRSYHWVYKDGENGYNEEKIESRFCDLSQGGSIDLQEDAISVVTINNPAKRNAFTGSMIVDLRKVVKKLWDSKSTKAVILCGADDIFCAGLDFGLAKKLKEPDDGPNMCMYMQNTLTLFQLLPSITVAAIKGGALGGGAEVITAADFRLVFPDSAIQFVQKKMGIIPGWGGTTRLCEIVGPRKAMHLLASSEVIDSKSAILIGLADALASDYEASSESDTSSVAAREFLNQNFNISETDASVFRAIKSAVYDVSDSGNRQFALDFKLKREKNILESVWGKPPNKKALNKVKTKS